MLRKLLPLRFASSKHTFDRFSLNYQLQYSNRQNKLLHNLSNFNKIDPSKFCLSYEDDTQDLISKVPKLQHGLDKYFNGQLVFGDQGIGKLPQLNEMSNEQIEKISGYTEPSKDPDLLNIGKSTKARYISSTSSISAPLTHLYYIFTRFRLPKADGIFEGYLNRQAIWMISMRKPVTFYLDKVAEDIDAITADHGVLIQSNSVLMRLGHVIEYFLTHTHQQTDKLIRGFPIIPQNYYRYAKVNSEFLLRSQIDCMSYNQNGQPFVFEIKSRACAPIRYDIENYKDYMDYQITEKRGLVESFQREYFDLIRGAFLKYILQVKIGKMDGAFIAYHNTEKIYGYQYVKRNEMAYRIFGNEYNLELVFVYLHKMLSIVLNHIRNSLPEHRGDSLKIGFYSQYLSKKLIAMVEGMTIVKTYIPLKEIKENFNTTDYFQQVEPIKNPVYKFEFDFQIFVNGAQQNNSQLVLTQHDTIQVSYKASQRKRVSIKQYIIFLYEGYKNEQLCKSTLYKGFWGNKQSSD